MNRRLRIVTYSWHTPYDYELTKLPHDFFYVAGTHREWRRDERPVPESITWVPSPRSVDADVMLLHVDPWTWHEPAERTLFEGMRDAFRGPKIVVSHVSNEVDGASSDVLRALVGDATIVAASAAALERWGAVRGAVVPPGASPDEWPETDYANHNVLHAGPYSERHAGSRNLHALARAEARVPITWIGRDVKLTTWARYRHFLRSSSIFFHPSHTMPSPHARTEAMLSGLAIVTTASHGERDYIRNGENGYCSNDVDELLDYLEHLHRNPQEVRRIGRAGRATAREVFALDRYVDRWDAVLAQAVGA